MGQRPRHSLRQFNNRFTGHASKGYSVGEHSIRVSDILESWEASAETMLWGLLHDASEAYVSDIARPLKQQPEFKFYRDMEKAIMDVIAAKFGLDPDEPNAVKEADTMMLSIEAEYLMPHRERAEWAWLPKIPTHMHNIGRDLGIANPDVVAKAFLDHYNYLESLRA
jgi:hypothetical protein